MNRSDEVKDLVTALSAFQGEIESAIKDAKASITQTREYKYATLASVWDAIRKPLAKNGLSITQGFAAVEDELQGRILRIETIMFHKTGQFLSSSLDMPMGQLTPQAMGSLITYGRRYSLLALTGICADDDDDGAAAMPKVGERQASQTSSRLQNMPSMKNHLAAGPTPKPVEEKSITEKLIRGELTEDPDPPTVNPGEPGKVSPFKKPEAAKTAHNDADPIDGTTWRFIKAQFPDNWADDSTADFEDWVRATLKANALTPIKDLSKLTRAMGRTLLQVATYCGAESVLESVVPAGYAIPKPKSPAK